MATKLRICTYSRVSTSHHDQRPEIQVEELRKYCEARGWAIAHEIIDHGFSGGTDNRPGLKQLFAFIRERKVDVVIVLKLDRLFRSLRHLVVTLEEFRVLGVEFIAVRDQIDYTTPSGRLLVQVLGSLAEFEKALIVERTMLGLAHARSKGKQLGRPQKHDYEAIAELHDQGLSYRQIRMQLHVPMGTITKALRSAHKSSPKSEKFKSGKSGSYTR